MRFSYAIQRCEKCSYKLWDDFMFFLVFLDHQEYKGLGGKIHRSTTLFVATTFFRTFKITLRQAESSVQL
jgi:hypothetical protein